jgi:hypothetical protein
MDLRVWDSGKSERRSVIERIGVRAIQQIAICPTRKRADFHTGVSLPENTANRLRREGK